MCRNKKIGKTFEACRIVIGKELAEDRSLVTKSLRGHWQLQHVYLEMFEFKR